MCGETMKQLSYTTLAQLCGGHRPGQHKQPPSCMCWAVDPCPQPKWRTSHSPSCHLWQSDHVVLRFGGFRLKRNFPQVSSTTVRRTTAARPMIAPRTSARHDGLQRGLGNNMFLEAAATPIFFRIDEPPMRLHRARRLRRLHAEDALLNASTLAFKSSTHFSPGKRDNRVPDSDTSG